jgi:hypothetical protein
MGRGVGRDEGGIDDEDKVEFRLLGQLRLLDIPVDVDAGVAGNIGVAPAMLVVADPGEDGAKVKLPLAHDNAPIG